MGARERRGRTREPQDPLAPVLGLGSRLHGVGFAVGLLGALLIHGSAAAEAANSLFAMADFARTVLVRVESQLRTRYDIDVDQPKKEQPKEEPPEPEQQDQPAPKAPPAPVRAPSDEPPPPPPPAEAAKVLTAEEDPDAPLDLTDQGFVSGSGARFAGGITTATGTSKTAVRSRAANKKGVEGGTGIKPLAKVTREPPPTADLSVSPKPQGSHSWNNCPFPPEADAAHENYARVVVTVLVGTDGRAKSVTVVSDPGFGFGREAKRCAMSKTYSVGKDRYGKPVTKTTPPIGITFKR